MSQDELNEKMAELGRESYQRNVRQARKEESESRTIVGKQLLQHAIPPFAQALHEWRGRMNSYKTPRKNRLAEMFDEFPDPVWIADFSAQVIIDVLHSPRSQQQVGYRIGKRLMEERRVLWFNKLAPQEYRHAKDKAGRQRRSVTWKRSKMAKIAKEIDSRVGADWGQKELKDLGIHILVIASKTTGLIELRNQRPPGGQKPGAPKGWYTMVVPTQTTIDWIESGHADLELRRPFYLPMVEPPWDWENQFNGGYPDGVWRRWPLVKQKKPYQHHYSPEKIPDIYRSVNHMQRTPWKVNARVLEIALNFWQSGGGVATLPSLEDLPLPQKPDDFLTNEEAKKNWKRKVAPIHQANNANKNRRLLHAGIIRYAKMFEGEERIYFPWNLDFRGRAYPIGSSYLHPQGCKFARSLLMFADGLPIPENDQVRWFMIHGANTFGKDKLPFSERLQWVQEAHSEILAVAEDPYDAKLWMDADDPWGFLAWCLEYRDWMTDPENFVSYLAVGQDHTNSGLQLYSLLLRDEKGAVATNVAPTERPNDSYQIVADVATEELKRIANDPNEKHHGYAQTWLRITDDRLPRGVTKRNVMTIPYGAKTFSQREYVEEWVRDYVAKSPDDRDRSILKNAWHFSAMLVPIIRESVTEVCPSPLVAMKFIRQLALALVKSGKQPEWTTPLGFRVVQECRKKEKHDLYLVGNLDTKKNRGHQNIALRGEKLSRHEAQDGMAPNFVHSLDATLMHRITNRLEDAGVNHICMIHDDYRTHAANAPLLADTTRGVLVETFTPDLLGDLWAQVDERLDPDVELPALPEYGFFRIHEVLEADYICS